MRNLLIAIYILLFAACASGPDAKSAVDRSAASVEPTNSAEIIYHALANIEEKDARPVDEFGKPSLGAEIMAKSIGGLTCKRTTVVAPNGAGKFSCSLGTPVVAQRIYESLNVEEKDVRQRTETGFVIDNGSQMHEKVVGALACRRITPSGRVSNYECEMRN